MIGAVKNSKHKQMKIHQTNGKISLIKNKNNNKRKILFGDNDKTNPKPRSLIKR